MLYLTNQLTSQHCNECYHLLLAGHFGGCYYCTVTNNAAMRPFVKHLWLYLWIFHQDQFLGMRQLGQEMNFSFSNAQNLGRKWLTTLCKWFVELITTRWLAVQILILQFWHYCPCGGICSDYNKNILEGAQGVLHYMLDLLLFFPPENPTWG